jgi:hypothetical protein
LFRFVKARLRWYLGPRIHTHIWRTHLFIWLHTCTTTTTPCTPLLKCSSWKYCGSLYFFSSSLNKRSFSFFACFALSAFSLFCCSSLQEWFSIEGFVKLTFASSTLNIQ